MGRSKRCHPYAALHIAHRQYATVRGVLGKRGPLQWAAFVTCLIVFGLGPFSAALRDADRYAEVKVSDWPPTNRWVKSTDCARRRHVWLAICSDDNKLIPISEYALGDDPGHALLLDVWAIASGKEASLVDVARLNIGLNTIGLMVLASFLFAIRAYVTSIVLIAAGPVIYLGWIGVSPHWSFIGITSMALVLPMAILAKEYGFLTRGSDNAYIALGIVALSLAALVREVIGDMGLVTTIAVIGFVAVRRRHLKGHWRGLLVLTSLVLVTSAMPTLVVGARDVSFAMEPARHVARHGFSDILYKGLGSVPNSLGIASYSDAASQAGVERVKPGVRYCSPEFYGILRKLYLEKVVHHPAEVMRIYVEKARLILADSILDLAPPLGVALIIALGHFIAATALGLWRRIGFSQGLLVEGAVIVLIGLFVAQAILADPNRMYAMPLGAALVMLLGVLVEFFGRAAVILLSRSKRKSHYMHPWSEHASEMDV